MGAGCPGVWRMFGSDRMFDEEMKRYCSRTRGSFKRFLENTSQARNAPAPSRNHFINIHAMSEGPFPPVMLTSAPPSGLCFGPHAGRLGDVRQALEEHKPARHAVRGGRPPPRFPQPVAALQGDAGGCQHLCGENPDGVYPDRHAPGATQTPQVGAHG